MWQPQLEWPVHEFKAVDENDSEIKHEKKSLATNVDPETNVVLQLAGQHSDWETIVSSHAKRLKYFPRINATRT